MNSLHEVGIARQGLQGVRLVGLEEVAEVHLLGIEISELLPGQFVLQVAPNQAPDWRGIRRFQGSSYLRPAGR
jgi:hypothetical protein